MTVKALILINEDTGELSAFDTDILEMKEWNPVKSQIETKLIHKGNVGIFKPLNEKDTCVIKRILHIEEFKGAGFDC